MKFTVFLDEIEPDAVGDVGPKAATLARLRRAGLPVPDGFVIPADLFDLVAEPAGLEPLLRDAARSAGELDAALVEKFAGALARSRVPVGAVDALHRAFDQLYPTTGAVVVRSSAMGEDLPGASAAGQYQTVLNVRDFPGLLAAVRECWLSSFRPATLRYHQRHGGSRSVPRLAVLVQVQVPCEVAGTLFTVDPVSGAGQIIIESTWGLGEAIAQGEVIPDRFVLDPVTFGELPGTKVAEKLRQRVPDSRQGTRLGDVPGWRRRRATLSRSDAGALAILGLRISEILGAPQDVEWGRAAGHWWIFQSRPITTHPRTKPDESSGPATRPAPLLPVRTRLDPAHQRDDSPLLSRWEWTSGFLDERLVEPVSPLGWSVLRTGLEEVAFSEPLRLLGVDPESLQPLTRLWNGHPYANVAVYEALYKLFPDWLLPEDARRFFPSGDTERRHRAPRPSGRLDLRAWCGLAGAILRYPTIVSPFQNDSAWNRFEPRYVAEISDLARWIDAVDARQDPAPDEVFRLLDEVERQNRALLRIHRWSLTYAEMWYSLLRRTATWLVGPAHANDLAVAAVSELNDQSVRVNHALAELRGRVADGTPLAVLLPDFLREFGHRSFSLDIMRPPFAADASQVLSLIEPSERPSPRPTRERGRSSAVERLLSPLTRLAWRYARLRENQRFAWQRGLAQVRRLYLILGRLLTRAGAMNRPEDVFALTANEVKNAIRSSKRDLHGVVAERFAELAAQQDLFVRLGRDSYPPFLRGNQPLADEPARVAPSRVAPPSARVVELVGTPVSPGLARGPARVILRATDLGAICPGEVLVARGADPGWTVVFDRLAGLVTESGGQLSHASVVAREYHLPAVVGVPRATDRIQNGDDLEIDGRNGVVRVTRRWGQD